MNILEVEDMVKGMPDEALQREAQQPTGQLPQFLVISEIQRRSDMRRRYKAQQEQPQSTVKDQILQGIGGMVPQQMRQDLGGAPQQGAPQMGMPAQPGGMGAPAGAPMQAPVQMASGGLTRMQDMGRVPSAIPAGLSPYGRSSPSLYNVKPNPLYEMLDFSDRRKEVLQGYYDRLARGEKLPAVALDALAEYEAEFPGLQGPGAPSADTMARRERLGIAELSTPTVEERAAINAAAPLTAAAAVSQDPRNDDREPPLDDSYFGGQPGGMPQQSGIGTLAVGAPSTEQMIAGATDFTGDPATDQLQKLLDAQKQRQTVDYSTFRTKLDERSKERMGQAETRVEELLREAEKETGTLSAEARRDATAQALIQFGAGIASGDISKGLEKAGTTAYAITAKARDDARRRMREARQEGRSTIDAARSAADSAFNTMLQLDMKTEEGKVAAANALQDSKNSILTAMAERAGENADAKRQIYASLARTTAAIEQAAIDRLIEMAKNQGLNQRAILTLVGDLVEGIPELSGASSDEIGQIVATIGSKIALQMGMDIGSLPKTGDEAPASQKWAGWSGQGVK